MTERVRDPFALWERTVRRAIRNHVRGAGEIPSLFAAVSIAANPRRLQAFPSLHVLPDGLAVRAELQHQLRRCSSRYGAYAAFVVEDAHERFPELAKPGSKMLGLTVVSLDRVMTKACIADPITGLSGWEPANFRPGDMSWIQDTIAENARVAL